MVLRALVTLAGIAALAAGAAWLAQSPGDVAIVWRGWRIDTSAAVLMSAVAALAVAVALVYRFWRALVHVPAAMAEARARGFSRTALMATLPGLRLYARFGYLAGEPIDYELGSALTMRLVPMDKDLD